jgi:aspergillopepsin I
LTPGGLPPIDFEESWTRTDILITNVEEQDQALNFYTINIDNMTVDNKTIIKAGGKNNQYIVSLKPVAGL